MTFVNWTGLLAHTEIPLGASSHPVQFTNVMRLRVVIVTTAIDRSMGWTGRWDSLAREGWSGPKWADERRFLSHVPMVSALLTSNTMNA